MIKIMKNVSVLSAVFLALVLCLGVSAPGVWAMSELEDGALSNETGEGLALVLSNISVKWGPTSYFEFTGTDEAVVNPRPYLRGDLRWYGLSYTGASAATGTTWGGSCSNGYLNLGCPMGGTIAKLAPHDNPIILRAFDYAGVKMDGVTETRSLFEVLFPSKHEPYRFAFWGEMNVGTGTTGINSGSTLGDGSKKLQVQNIWNNIDQSGSSVRFFQTSEATSTDRTFGIQYINKFAANIRMSVAQTFASPDTLGQTPEFDDSEGLYMGDFRILMTSGQLHYQALVIDDVPAKDGNFQIKLTPIPNTANIYNVFYGRTIATDPQGGYDRTKFDDAGDAGFVNYNLSHGYTAMGDFAPTQKANTNAAYPYNPACFSCTDAPVYGMPSEVSACAPDRTGCAAGTGSLSGPNGNNGQFDTTNGIFFVAAPGESFNVYQKSPNYMYDGNVDSDLNSNVALDANQPSQNIAARQDLTRINLGDVNIRGMVMHSLTVTTLGAQ